MNYLSAKHRKECIEYVKQETLLFYVDQQVKSPSNGKQVSLSRSYSCTNMTDFRLNAENDDGDHVDQQASSKTWSHVIEIDLYLKHGSDKTTTETSVDHEIEEYNPRSF